MTDSLKEAISQYENQLSQIHMALSATPDGPDKDNLLSLRADIEELVSLTKENLQQIEVSQKDKEKSNDNADDSLAKEYAMFKAELGEISKNSNSAVMENTAGSSSVDIEDELKALEGMKCRAPHGSAWCGIGYHNAMVCSTYESNTDEVQDMQDIKVKVLFLNPTHKEMLPCSYFLNGSCKFMDENCNFSHGEIVPLSSLKEYRDPDYESIKVGSRVLAKNKNRLWHRAVVLKLPDTDSSDYRIKFEANGNITETPLQDLVPLDDEALELSDTSDDSASEDSEKEVAQEVIIQQSLFTIQPNMPLGNWEKHTRGIGSKLMAQMGYITGAGLGKKADGRVQPVEATVLPAGKSLDHCMELREHAGGDKDLFSVARKMHKEQRKLEQQRQKQYEREKQREKANVFNFINATLGDKPKDQTSGSDSIRMPNFKTETNQKLNVAHFQIGENISRLEKESSKLKDSLARHTKGSIPYNRIVMQYNEKQKELLNLRACEKNILVEQNQRKNKAKLCIF